MKPYYMYITPSAWSMLSKVGDEKIQASKFNGHRGRPARFLAHSSVECEIVLGLVSAIHVQI